MPLFVRRTGGRRPLAEEFIPPVRIDAIVFGLPTVLIGG